MTKKEFEIISKHLLLDIQFKENGTFNKLSKDSEFIFDNKEAQKVINILDKLSKKIQLIN